MPDAPSLVVLSAGAAKGVVEALQPEFRTETGAGVAGTFGAVGAIREKFVANDACDVLILTAAMLDGTRRRRTRRPRHDRAARPRADRASPCAAASRIPRSTPRRHCARASRQARSLYCPDPERATAGIHFVKVLRELGLWPECASRLAAYPSGAVAMRALADTTGPGAVGCTQVTEILYTPGVDLVGPLPAEFTLATMYSVAVGTRAPQPALARRFAALVAGPATQELRERGGFIAASGC